MDRFEPNLRIPGPTALPPRVREAGGRQMINHRGPEFAAMLERILDRDEAVLRDDARTSRCSRPPAPAASRPPSSTRCRRATASSACRSARSATGSRRSPRIYGADVTKLDVEWGYAAADRRGPRARSRAGPAYQAVLLTHNETSTGVMNPIAELAAASASAAPDALILVDSVSGLGAVPFEMDAWGVDVVVTGSQKAWMSAPGLAMIAASPRAWAAMETATMPRFYLDLRAHRESHAAGQTPFTPAIAVVYQVDEGLRLMTAEGAERDLRPPRGVRRRGPGRPDRARLRAVRRPARRLEDRHRGASSPTTSTGRRSTASVKRRGVVLAGGQGKLTGKIFRLGHLGLGHASRRSSAR